LAWLRAEVGTISIAVEGASDVAAVVTMLRSRGITVEPTRIFVTRGKAKLDSKLKSYNKAAAFSPWLVLRDADHDEGGCPVAVRKSRLSLDEQNPAFCFRLAVRSLEAWLLADAEAFAATFSVTASAIPRDVEQLADPKQAVVNLCQHSRKSAVRQAMVPPEGSAGRVGPEYVTWITEYSRSVWRPDVAATSAPSLARALQNIDRLVASGIW
jgi:hypothetical protein